MTDQPLFQFPGVGASAVLSDDGVYRYRLDRRWGDGPVAAWVMLNPSTADATLDDHTIRRCLFYSRREQCGALTVVNLMACRATEPWNLLAAVNAGVDVEGPDNLTHVNAALTQPNIGVVIVAWGGWLASVPPKRRPRTTDVATAISDAGHPAKCLGYTSTGEPCHPARLRNDAPLLPWPRLPHDQENR